MPSGPYKRPSDKELAELAAQVAILTLHFHQDPTATVKPSTETGGKALPDTEHPPTQSTTIDPELRKLELQLQLQQAVNHEAELKLELARLSAAAPAGPRTIPEDGKQKAPSGEWVETGKRRCTEAAVAGYSNRGGPATTSGRQTGNREFHIPNHIWQNAKEHPNEPSDTRNPEKRDGAMLSWQEKLNWMLGGKCFFCGQRGHLACNCPKKQQKQQDGKKDGN
ncbi:hypothetical protein HYH03_008606 [Edaphochlamys debaryana]|uniref:CCHC-type domain-containing protein n=1 Tax=Edaphochlamys debaryana TaxID=47281 RepID=A0A835XZP1_9CHLO|nr:hypothetical protein HYH03_008606 [Edaphochlamys debaryana]|eukprot:KAG2493186.1 hypothetical protein HYH03_008606 [Edaphochlamys debaryana]